MHMGVQRQRHRPGADLALHLPGPVFQAPLWLLVVALFTIWTAAAVVVPVLYPVVGPALLI